MLPGSVQTLKTGHASVGCQKAQSIAYSGNMSSVHCFRSMATSNVYVMQEEAAAEGAEQEEDEGGAADEDEAEDEGEEAGSDGDADDEEGSSECPHDASLTMHISAFSTA